MASAPRIRLRWCAPDVFDFLEGGVHVKSSTFNFFSVDIFLRPGHQFVSVLDVRFGVLHRWCAHQRKSQLQFADDKFAIDVVRCEHSINHSSWHSGIGGVADNSIAGCTTWTLDCDRHTWSVKLSTLPAELRHRVAIAACVLVTFLVWQGRHWFQAGCNITLLLQHAQISSQSWLICEPVSKYRRAW